MTQPTSWDAAFCEVRKHAVDFAGRVYVDKLPNGQEYVGILLKYETDSANAEELAGLALTYVDEDTLEHVKEYIVRSQIA